MSDIVNDKAKNSPKGKKGAVKKKPVVKKKVGPKKKQLTKKEKQKKETAATKLRKKHLLEAMEKTAGVVQAACAMAKVSRETYYKYLREDEEFRKVVERLKDVGLDHAEYELFKLIKKGNVAAIIFYLKTQGKKRGYVERQEVTGKDGRNLYADMSEEEIEKEIEKIQSTP